MFTQEVDLGILPKPDYWAIRQSLIWRSPELETTIPAGFVTDLASIPTFLKNVLDVTGRSREPAILHDWLYCCQKTSRTFADAMLRRGLVAYGESPRAATLYWSGVRVGGWLPWDRRLRRGSGLHVDDFVSVQAYMNALPGLSIKEITT